MKSITEIIAESNDLIKQNQWLKAEAVLSAALKQYPEHATPHFLLGMVYFRQGRFEDAASQFQSALQLDPNDVTILNNLGLVLYKLGRFPGAETAFANALSKNPRYPEALYNYGRLKYERNQKVQSYFLIDTCLRIDPSHDAAKHFLGHYEKSDTVDMLKEKYKKILIVMEEGIGNMVMLTPTLKAVKEMIPDCCLTVVGRQPSVQVIQNWDNVDKVLTEPDDEQYDVCFLTVWSGRFAKTHQDWMKKQCKEYVRFGLEKDQHESEAYFRIAKSLGYQNALPQPFCQIKTVGMELSPNKKVVAISDTTLNNGAWERKRWPYYKELANVLIKSGYSVLLIGGEGEAGRFREGDWPSGVVNCLGKYDLQETAGLLSKCDLFVGNDSGPAHMAAALGIPTYVLFGPTLVTKNRPLGPKVHVIKSNLKCSPCQYTDRWEKCSDWRCTKEISVNKILCHLNDGRGVNGTVIHKKAKFNTNIKYWEDRYKQAGGEKTVGHINWDQEKYDEENKLFMNKMSHLLDNLLLNKKVNSLLDFGCGIGRFTNFLRNYSDKYFGVDIVDDVIVKNIKKYKKDTAMNFSKIEESRIPFQEMKFDIIWCCVVLQHIIDDELLIHYANQFHDLLEDDGSLVFIENVTNASNHNYLKFRSVEKYIELFNKFEIRHIENYFFNNEPHAIMIGKKKSEVQYNVQKDDTGFDDNYYKKAMFYYQEGKLDKAIGILEEVCKTTRNDSHILNKLGMICFEKGRLDAAIRYLNQAIKVNPIRPDTWYNLGRLFLQLGHKDKTVAAWQQCVIRNPGHPEIRENLKNLPVDKIKLIVSAMSIASLPSKNLKPLKLMSTNYLGCKLIERGGKKYITRGEIEEPLRIHLVSGRWANHPYGMGNEIYQAIEDMGIDIIDTDFRKDFNRLSELLKQDAHITIVLKGNAIPAEEIKEIPSIKVLWYPDDLLATQHGPHDISNNGYSFDLVYGFSNHDLEEYKKYGVSNAKWLPLAFNPKLHRKIDLPKIHDICFVGNIYPNRKALIERLSGHFNVFVTHAFTEEMVRIFNQSKIVLNLGIGKGGIQLRVFEALGCSAFLLTNEIPKNGRLFEDRKHLVYFNGKNIEELIEYYLNNEEEREEIAMNGYRQVHENHTFHNRIAQIISDCLIYENNKY